MDTDSSSKFIGSLTKFLQSLCNGYVEFQRGVELVGHIYLSIDTGEKVDYILHEKVSKNDENSVTFVSNSFHAQPQDKVADKPADKKVAHSSGGPQERDSDSDSDIMIVDQSRDTPGSTNYGTIPPKRVILNEGTGHQNQGTDRVLSPQRNRQQSGRPSATMTSQGTPQENINIGEVKLEQISSDELLSLASQVGDEESASNFTEMQGRVGPPGRLARRMISDTAGQPVWIKQEPGDEMRGGPDTGWSQGGDNLSDSSNSGSNLYPVMMHQNQPGYSSNPIFPGSSSSSLGFPHSHPGTSGAANLYSNPMPGTSHSMSNMDPAVWTGGNKHDLASPRKTSLTWQRLKMDRARHERKKHQNRAAAKRYRDRTKLGEMIRWPPRFMGSEPMGSGQRPLGEGLHGSGPMGSIQSPLGEGLHGSGPMGSGQHPLGGGPHTAAPHSSAAWAGSQVPPADMTSWPQVAGDQGGGGGQFDIPADPGSSEM